MDDVPHGCRRRRLAPLGPRSLIAPLLAVVLAALPAGTAAAVDGAWGYFGNPRAVYRDGIVYYGYVTSRGDVAVAARDVHRGTETTFTLWRRFGIDDHDNPSLWIRPDGRIVAFWSPHSGYHLPRGRPSRLYYRVSCRPLLITCFRPVRHIHGNTAHNTLGYTYPSPLYLEAHHTLWLFWRGGDWQPTYARSRDGGRHFARPHTLLTGGRKVYAAYGTDGGRGFHVAVVGDNPSVSANALYYLHYRHGRFYHADGTPIGDVRDGVRLQQGDVIYVPGMNGTTNSWVLDVAQDADQHPIVLYRLAGGPGAGYWYARWTGSGWATSRIVASWSLSGEVLGRPVGGSMGGAMLDHEDPSVVYLSRVSGPSAEVDVATTADGGRTWTLEPISRDDGSPWPSLRPTSPLGLGQGRIVLWMQGWYHDFMHYLTGIRISVEGVP